MSKLRFTVLVVTALSLSLVVSCVFNAMTTFVLLWLFSLAYQ